MKRIIFIAAALFVFLNVDAQKDDTLHLARLVFPVTDFNNAIHNDRIVIASGDDYEPFIFYSGCLGNCDTSKAILFYIDTARTYTTTYKFIPDTSNKSFRFLTGHTVEDTIYYSPNSSVHWFIGYVVKRLHNRDEGWPMNYNPDDDVAGYLNADKKPLRKSLIICLSIKLN